MDIFQRMALEKRARLENPKTPISAASALEHFDAEASPSGVSVSPDRALGITAFWAGVRAISQTIAGLPLQVYERVDDRTRRPAPDHPVYQLVFKRPNPNMSAFTFKEMRILHLLMWGNAYAEIQVGGDGRPEALWPLLPDRTDVVVRDGQKYYSTIIDDKKIMLSPDKVLHVPGPGFDGLQGYNVIKVHRDSLGLSAAANEYGARFFGNSGRPSGYIKHPGEPNEEERKQLREEWNQVHSGLTSAQRTAVLWGNMEWEKVSMPPEEAQFIQTREMQIEEVARILNINPILLQHFSKATTWGSGVAQFLTAFGKFTIQPWLDRDEDVLDWDLFTENERGRFYTKYNLDALLRGDVKTQAEVLEIKRRNGVINADEWRALDEENPLPEGQGQQYFMPLNMAPINQMIDRDTDDLPRRTRERRSTQMRGRLRDAHKSSFADGARRYVRRDVSNLKRAARKAAEQQDPIAYLERWIEDFYPGQERVIRQTMLPMVAALADSIGAEAADEIGADPVDMDTFAEEYTDNLAMREAGSSRGQVLALAREVPAEELGDALEERASEWEENRPGKVAMNEVVRVATGASRYAWGAVGVSFLVWRANPDACPLCEEMDGRRVGIQEHFLSEGDSVTPDDRPGGIQTDHDVAGPPLHQGCQCDIEPEV